MLKFLTHKLRTHSINEDNFTEKADEDHDSGTESDDEIEDPELSAPAMSERMCSVSPADTGCSMESPAPDQHDPHSSEEELEVINSTKQARSERPFRAASVCLPEKRKWSQVGDSYARWYSPENEENMSHYGNLSPASPCSPYGNKYYGDDTVHLEHSGSSDDEVHHLLASMATPVQFRTSPPLEAVKPGGRTPNSKIRSLSPPPKLVHYEVSPRKRSRHTRHLHVQRPCLDFEKMQQLKARSVTPWRNSSDHGGELSVFCW
ncbi:hypothetical protein ILUMI_04360 [Ignelater luminosus]|uniref:Uncharacterized protein n=1 Tax=Ignelater luminosus TaxID=2038154 RepID=A0A8K0GL93_IGNLU|nr:hypothetical protein ILUMI_04360 [Ignelater luminosus]